MSSYRLPTRPLTKDGHKSGVTGQTCLAFTRVISRLGGLKESPVPFFSLKQRAAACRQSRGKEVAAFVWYFDSTLGGIEYVLVF